MKKGQLTQYKIITITAVLVVLACSFAIYLRLFTEKELWYEMFAAVLGVIITAIITMILLRGQSDNDVEGKERPGYSEKSSKSIKSIFPRCAM